MPGPQPLLDRRSLADQAIAAIRRLVLDGTLPLGGRITEEDLAARLGISRTPVREALRRLTEAGLLEVVGSRQLRVPRLDGRAATDLAAVRSALDGLAAAACATAALDAGAIARLRAMAATIAERFAAGDTAGGLAADAAFHLALAHASGNAELAAHLERLDGRIQLWRLGRCREPDKIRRDIRAHERVLDAIAAGDASAAETLARTHALGEPHDEAPGSARRRP